MPCGANVLDAWAAVLARREARRDEQVHLLRFGWPVVSLTVVTPGADKDDDIARSVVAWAVASVSELLAERGWQVLEARSVGGPTGPEWLASVQAPEVELKTALMQLEDASPIGRLCDLDVLTGPDASGQPRVLSRRDLGRPGRTCLVCEREAAACARSARHHPLLVGAARAGMACGGRRMDAERAASVAVDALLLEARLTPKPGLVDAVSSGAHDDMDLDLLERSAEALRPWFAACWWRGWSARAKASTDVPGELRGSLAPLGVAGEDAMLAATAGVNTHRGALFALGLLVGALGAVQCEQSVQHGRSAQHDESALSATWAVRGPVSGGERALLVLGPLCSLAAEVAEPWLTEWLAMPDGSHGASALRLVGVTGARGEAALGFPTARRVGVPAYRERLVAYADADDAARWALVCLMAVTDDTNLVARGGAGAVGFVQRWARGVVERSPAPDELVAELAAAESDFVARRLSPGGSADLLAVSLFLHRIDLTGLECGRGPG